MCGLCGALGRGPSWEQGGDMRESARWQLRREAQAAARELTRFLARTRIKVVAGADRGGYLVTFPTGRVELASSLSEIWHCLGKRDVSIPDVLAVGEAE